MYQFSCNPLQDSRGRMKYAVKSHKNIQQPTTKRGNTVGHQRMCVISVFKKRGTEINKIGVRNEIHRKTKSFLPYILKVENKSSNIFPRNSCEIHLL